MVPAHEESQGAASELDFQKWSTNVSKVVKAPYTVVTRAMHIHPTVSEYLPSLFYALEPLGR